MKKRSNRALTRFQLALSAAVLMGLAVSAHAGALIPNGDFEGVRLAPWGQWTWAGECSVELHATFVQLPLQQAFDQNFLACPRTFYGQFHVNSSFIASENCDPARTSARRIGAVEGAPDIRPEFEHPNGSATASEPGRGRSNEKRHPCMDGVVDCCCVLLLSRA